MRKAFAFLTSSLSSNNKFSSEETKASTQTTSPDTRKENNKSQTISKTKHAKSLQNKHNTNEKPTKNNNEINSSNKIKKSNSNDLKNFPLIKSASEIKKLGPTIDLKKQDLQRKTSITSNITTSTITVSTLHSSSNRRKKLAVIKNSDSESTSESESESESDSDSESENTNETNSESESESANVTNNDNEEVEEDDEHVPLGLRLQHYRTISSDYPPPSPQRCQEYDDDDDDDDEHIPLGLHLQHYRTIRSNYPPSSPQRSQEYVEGEDDEHVPLGLLQHYQSIRSNYPPPSPQRCYDDVRIRNISGMSLHHNRSITPDSNTGEYHYHYPPPQRLSQHSPVPTTPPLIHTSHQPRPHYSIERRSSSSSSASSRYYRNSNASHYRNITPNHSQRNDRSNRYSTSYWNENNGNIHYNHHRYCDDELYDGYGEHRIPSDDIPFAPSTQSRMPPGSTTRRRSNGSNGLVVGANPPPSNKYKTDATKTMSTAEYHRYQREMVTAQYLKHGINPMVDSMRPKRLSMIGSYSSSGSNTSPPAGRTSYTRTTSYYGEINSANDHRRTHFESNVLHPRYSTRYHHYHHHNTPQFHNSVTSLSSSSSTYVSSNSSGSYGPPTPTSRRSSIMFSSNVNIASGSRPSTPSSVGSVALEKEKRRKSILREYKTRNNYT